MFKTKQTLWLTVSLAFNLAVLATLIYTWQSHANRRGPHDRHRYATSWTEIERTRIDSLRAIFPSRIKNVRDSLSAERLRMADHLNGDFVDSLQVYRHLDRIALWQAHFSRAVYHQMLDESQVLSPEHRDEFIATMIRRMTRGSRRPNKAGPRKRQAPPQKK